MDPKAHARVHLASVGKGGRRRGGEKVRSQRAHLSSALERALKRVRRRAHGWREYFQF